MEFSDKELLLIKKASTKIKQANFIRIFLILAMLVSLLAMIYGNLVSEDFVYLSFFIVFISIALPQLGAGPKYEDLVGLLASKCITKDPMLEILKSKYKI